MSLPPGQLRVLERIEGKLSESDPRLVSLFMIFTRLTRAERMPWIEQVRARPIAYRIARMVRWFRRRGRRHARRVGGMLLLPTALTAAACAVIVAFGFPNGPRGGLHSARAPAARSLVVKRSLVVNRAPGFIGRARMCRVARVPVFAC